MTDRPRGGRVPARGRWAGPIAAALLVAAAAVAPAGCALSADDPADPGAGAAPAIPPPSAGPTRPPAPEPPPTTPPAGGAPSVDPVPTTPGSPAPPPPATTPPAPPGTSPPAGPGGPPAEGQPITDGLTQLLVSSGIGLGYYHACHILESKKVKCFGTEDPRNRPPADVAAATSTQIFCAHNGCCALLPPSSAKRLSCWSHKATFYPPATGVDPIHFGIGYDHGCAINKDQSVRCWGQGRGPQVTAPPGLKARSLAVAAFFNCAVLLDDSVQCWGIKAPPPPAGLKAKLVAAIYHGNLRADMDDLTQGTSHACAVTLDDTLTCWGDNVEGTTDVPADLGKVKDVAVASWNTCALRLNGEPVCWGTKKYNSSPQRFNPQPPGLRLKGIRSKLATYCGLQMDNTLACWGDEANVHITIDPPTTKFFTP